MRGFICALALVITAPAWAQEEGLTAAPGSIAYGMIENANADGVFELVHDGQVTVRHTGSGLICHFARSGEGGRLVLYDGMPRGDNVSCDVNDGRQFITLYATRFPTSITLEDVIAGTVETIRTRYPDAVSLPASANAQQAPPRLSTQFIVVRNGERMFTHASVARVGAWTIKLRYSAPAPDDAAARQAEAAARAMFDAALGEIQAPPNL